MHKRKSSRRQLKELIQYYVSNQVDILPNSEEGDSKISEKSLKKRKPKMSNSMSYSSFISQTLQQTLHIFSQMISADKFGCAYRSCKVLMEGLIMAYEEIRTEEKKANCVDEGSIDEVINNADWVPNPKKKA